VASLTETEFLRETAWCILNGGMREKVVRRLFPTISACFWHFESVARILRTEETCQALAQKFFNHPGKISAILKCVRVVRDAGGFAEFRTRLEADPIGVCIGLPYIGPVTVWHLARNIGVDCAKPDRHLARLTSQFGYVDASALCQAVAAAVGERIGVVDVVLWRHAESACACAAGPAA
jgi:hypothetical protein